MVGRNTFGNVNPLFHRLIFQVYKENKCVNEDSQEEEKQKVSKLSKCYFTFEKILHCASLISTL